jgi:hypothetical protein
MINEGLLIEMFQTYNNIRMLFGSSKVEDLVLEANELQSSSDPITSEEKISNIVKQVEAWNKSWLNLSGKNIDQQILAIEFKAKTTCPHYTLQSSIAKHVLSKSLDISDDSVQEKDVFWNPEEFYYLTSKEQYLYKHIETHVEKWGVNTKIRKQFGKITFHNGESVESIMKASNGPYMVTAEGPKPVIQRDESGNVVLQSSFQRNENSTYMKGSKIKNFEEGKFYVSLVSSKPSSHISPIGHHSWLRLTDGEGKVSSVGKWPAKQPIRFVANVDPQFQAPDPHEWTDPSSFISEEVIEITAEEYDRLKGSIEDDINHPDTETNTYNTVLQNCSDWVIEILEKNKIIDELDQATKGKLKINMFRALLPSRINFIADDVDENPNLKYLKFAVEVIAIPFRIILRPISRGFLLLLGASVKRECDSFSLINGLHDFLCRGVLKVTHPINLQKYATLHFPEQSAACSSVRTHTEEINETKGEAMVSQHVANVEEVFHMLKLHLLKKVAFNSSIKGLIKNKVRLHKLEQKIGDLLTPIMAWKNERQPIVLR